MKLQCNSVKLDYNERNYFVNSIFEIIILYFDLSLYFYKLHFDRNTKVNRLVWMLLLAKLYFLIDSYALWLLWKCKANNISTYVKKCINIPQQHYANSIKLFSISQYPLNHTTYFKIKGNRVTEQKAILTFHWAVLTPSHKHAGL